MRTPGSLRCWATHSVERSEEHTSELQSQSNLVCRLLLEKKKNTHREHGAFHYNPVTAHPSSKRCNGAFVPWRVSLPNRASSHYNQRQRPRAATPLNCARC